MESIPIRALAARWLALDCAANPLTAGALGVQGLSGRLSDYSPDTRRRYQKERMHILDDLDQFTSGPLTPDQLELRLLRADVRRGCLDYELEPWRRAPYIYVEEIGTTLNTLLTDQTLTPHARNRMLLAVLDQVPELLDQAEKNLVPADIPRQWWVQAMSGIAGVQSLLNRDLASLLQRELADQCRAVSVDPDVHYSRLTRAVEAVDRFAACLRDMEPRLGGDFVVGSKHLDQLLSEFHLLPSVTWSSLQEFGERQVARTTDHMAHCADQVASGMDWQTVLDRIADHHPAADELISAYEQARDQALDHIRNHDLITIPPGETCQVMATPEFIRASIPLGVMLVSPPLSERNESSLLITPVDTSVDQTRQLAYLREQNYGFIRSITFHELYPGHHLQSVLHKQAPGVMQRKFRSPLLVEGWGLYTEDLMEETGFLGTPELKFLKARNAVWRAVRIVIDMGLHSGQMSIDEAVDILRTRAGQSEGMARGEVQRYTRHDNPTYQSCYMYGCIQIHKLREDYRERMGDRFSLKMFHDNLLAHGSPPVSLLRDIMLGPM